MANDTYDHLKCKHCNRVHPAGTKTCDCGTALAVYGVPCNAQGVEKDRGRGTDIGPEIDETTEQHNSRARKEPPVVVSPEPPKPQKAPAPFWKKYGLLVLAVVCFLIAAASWDDSHLDEMGPPFLVFGIIFSAAGTGYLVYQASRKNG